MKTKKKKIARESFNHIEIDLDKKCDADAMILDTLENLYPRFEERGMGVNDLAWALLLSVEPDSSELSTFLDDFFDVYDNEISKNKA